MPQNSYIICSDKRTGSTLLCEALRLTGIAGSPAEYFNAFPPTQRYRRHYLGITNEREYLQKVVDASTSQNGVFGTKIQADEFPLFLSKLEAETGAVITSPAAALAERFPNLKYIWLMRDNTLRQAVSLFRARNTHRWWKFTQVPPGMYRQGVPDVEKEFDFKTIQEYMEDITKKEAMWKHFFEENSIVPLKVTYEELTGKYEDTIRKVLRYLDLPADIPIPPPQTVRQADNLTDEWEKKFLKMQTEGY